MLLIFPMLVGLTFNLLRQFLLININFLLIKPRFNREKNKETNLFNEKRLVLTNAQSVAFKILMCFPRAALVR